MNKFIILSFFLLFFQYSISQKHDNQEVKERIKLSGKVIETPTNIPLEYATIVLTNQKTKKIYGGITNQTGEFLIDIPKGFYDIKIEFVGFKTKKLKPEKLTVNKNLGVIKLSEDNEQLQEVEIIAEKSTVEIKLDKKIYNVGKDMTIKGGNASDVLDNVPSVNVDAEGNVSLRGNENVRILINGKPSALVGLNGSNALKNLPSDAIEKVEVITSPSARYDAEGTAGILNIILRKGKITGFNGSISTSIGYPELYQISGNLNYRTKKFNIYSNLGYSYNGNPRNASFNTQFLDSLQNILKFGIQNRDYTIKRNSYNGSLGLEYYLNETSSITGTFIYQKYNAHNFIENTSKNLNRNKVLQETSIRETNETENNNTYQYALNYTNNFNKNGQKLNIDLQYGNSYEEKLFAITDKSKFNSNNNILTKSDDLLFQIDYILPFRKKNQIELGHKTDYLNVKSNFDTTDKKNNKNNKNNQILDFEQTIYAYYVQYGNKINRFSYLLGLRTETTKADIDLVGGSDLASSKNYTKLFPTVNFGYEINNKSSLLLGYSKRVKRPNYWFLNPFIKKSSNTFVFQGSPDLDPTFTDSFNLNYNTKIHKLNLGTSVYYQNSKNPISVSSRLIKVDNVETEIRQPVNLDNESRYGLEFNTNYSPTKWLRLSGSFNYFNYKTAPFKFVYSENGMNQVINFNEVNESSWVSRFSSRIILHGKINWQNRLLYRGAQKSAQTDRKGIFIANLAFSKELFNEKASLVLNINDVFNTRKRDMTTYNENRINPESISNVVFQWRQRQISLNFTYRFNQKKNKKNNRNNYTKRNESGGF